MDFFEGEFRARRHTLQLLLLFGAAVVSIATLVDVVAAFAVSLASASRYFDIAFWPEHFSFHLLIFGATFIVILLGSIFKIMELGGGGPAVARSLGARAVDPSTRDPGERRLWNVVEEMSIAAGVAVPDLYVLTGESAVNAFAAGVSPNAAVITVTEGALKRLTRNELQGVIGHEFSHILNGDMRLNLRLIGTVAGILTLAVIGRVLMQARGKNSGGVVVLGALLFAVGYVGVFFAQIIKSAVARERERLADASAVQFARETSGLVGALVKIRDGSGSLVRAPRAEEVSHFFFAQGVSGFFATHPPIGERLRSLDPDGAIEAGLKASPREAEEAPRPVAPPAFQSESSIPARMSGPASASASPIASVGMLPAASVEAAARLSSSIPAEVFGALRDPAQAVSCVFGLLMDADPAVRSAQRETLGPDAAAPAEAAAQALAALGNGIRFPAMELAAPALRRMPEDLRGPFLEKVRALSLADNRLSPFEGLMGLFLKKVLGKEEAPPSISEEDARRELWTVLSHLACAGAEGDSAAARRAFEKGWEAAGWTGRREILPEIECGPEAFAAAVERLRGASLKGRQRLLESSAACIMADGKVTPYEGECLRVLAAVWDCPLPLPAAEA